jgi:NAD(P)-dependent dehydrogenase (short-subunit alcohol dehydrogenase family)
VAITGAAGGIGAACAETLAARGLDLVLADIEAPHATADRVRTHGGRVVAVRCDVTSESDCAALAEVAVAELGGIDGGVLAAGYAHHAPLLSLPADQWRALLDVHLTGTFLSLKALAARMRRPGALVCLSSTVANAGGPARQAHYVAAKAGTLGLVRAAARELGVRGIRVNAVSPGFTETPMNTGLFSDDERATRASRAPLGRIALPRDIASVVAFLLGSDSAFMTGQELRVDGGAGLG